MNELAWIGIAGVVLGLLIIATMCAVRMIAKAVDEFIREDDDDRR
jgi:hypothetical protein